MGDVNVAEVERVVDGLHLPHFDEPNPHGLGSSLQHSLTVVLSLVQHLQSPAQRGDTESLHSDILRNLKLWELTVSYWLVLSHLFRFLNSDHV